MAGRIRTIKPEWIEDEAMLLASPAARVLSIALILMADDHGRGRANRLLIVSRIFPRHPKEGDQGYVELLGSGFFRVYQVRGQEYYQITNWARHQKVDKPGNPRVPCACGSLEKDHDCLANFPETVENPSEVLAPDRDHDQDHDQDRDHDRQKSRGAREVKNQEAFDLVSHFVEAIQSHAPDFKPPASPDRWAYELDKLMRIDKREPKAIRAAIDWVHRNDTERSNFWKPNILSPAKLRKQWDRLSMQARQERAKPSSQDWDEMARRLEEQGL